MTIPPIGFWSEQPLTRPGFVDEIQSRLHHARLAKAGRSYRRTCRQAQETGETLWDYNRNSGRPKKLRVCFWWVLTRPRISPQAAGLKTSPLRDFIILV